jgi:tRNA-splicing ligase RtcB
MEMQTTHTLQRTGQWTWELPATGGMLVPGRIYADESLVEVLSGDGSLDQVANVAHLPGIICCSLAMPDIHFGYGFPIGGVAAFEVERGVVSPGGVGYDINCGVRLLATDLSLADIRDKIKPVVDQLFRDVPAGVGSRGAIAKLARGEMERVLAEGAVWAVKHGYGSAEDLDHTESTGTLPGADPGAVSERAYTRGQDQVGTLGSGNHFLEVQTVEEIFDREAAAAYGLHRDQITIMIHCGSRGLGYQICDDYLGIMADASRRYGIDLPDRQLVCAPVTSPEGRSYLAAMACAANYAWANRQMIKHLAEGALLHALRISPKELNLRLVYDVAHNIAKLETHEVDGKQVQACVHRKGATRAFGPGRPEIPAGYQRVGQPVLIPGDMGTASFVCRGTTQALAETFGSTCHGAGRVSCGLWTGRGYHPGWRACALSAW